MSKNKPKLQLLGLKETLEIKENYNEIFGAIRNFMTYNACTVLQEKKSHFWKWQHKVFRGWIAQLMELKQLLFPSHSQT